MKSTLGLRAQLTTAMFTVLATPAFAWAADQDAQSEAQASSSADIIVTARRVEERLQDVPISITVLTPEQISNRNIVSANDLGSYIPSLNATPRFGPDNASFSIRGFTQDPRTAPPVAVYFADVTSPRSQSTTAGGNGAGPGNFFDLQNIQVLKGPQGTLFGRNTTGGAILLVPQKPTGRFEGYVEGSIGNYNLRRAQAVLNVPVSDSIRARFGVDRQKRDGYARNGSGIGPKDFYDIDYLALRGSLTIDFADNFENYTVANYSDSDTSGAIPRMQVCNSTLANSQPAAFSNGYIYSQLACRQLARQEARGDGFYGVENGNPLSGQKIKQWQVINTTTFVADDTLTFKNIASYGEYRQRNAGSLFGEYFPGPFSSAIPPSTTPVQILTPGQPFGFNYAFALPGYYGVSQWTATEEFQIQGRSLDGKFNFQGGIYLEISRPLGGFQGTGSTNALSCTDLVNLGCIDVLRAVRPGNPATGNQNRTFTKNWFRNHGVYGQATYNFTDKLSMTAGIRYTSDTIRSTGRQLVIEFADNPADALPPFGTPRIICSTTRQPPVNGDVSSCDRTLEQQSSKPTWVIDLDYKPNDDMLLYAKWSRGYRQGGLNTASAGFGETWGPETVDTYEGGFKASFNGALRGYFNLAAFYTDFRNQQVLASAVPRNTGSQSSGTVNAGKSRMYGVEIDASVTPWSPLTLDLAYAYLNTKIVDFVVPDFDPTRFSAVNPTVAKGTPITYTPKNRVTATLTYRLPLPEDLGKLSVGATFTHTSKQFAVFNNPIGTLPSTNVLNLNMNWNGVAGMPVDFSIFATNVLKEKYLAAVNGSYAATGFDAGILAPPRMYGARLRYRFGN